MSIDISHETEARLTDEARRQDISVEALLKRLMSEYILYSTGGTSTTMSVDDVSGSHDFFPLLRPSGETNLTNIRAENMPRGRRSSLEGLASSY